MVIGVIQEKAGYTIGYMCFAFKGKEEDRKLQYERKIQHVDIVIVIQGLVLDRSHPSLV